jgi:hypothetical protein
VGNGSRETGKNHHISIRLLQSTQRDRDGQKVEVTELDS